MQIPWVPVATNTIPGSLLPPPFLELLRNWSVMSDAFRDAFDNWKVNVGPQITIAGDAKVEGEINGSVASYGKQLGIIQEALVELAGDTPKGPKMERLQRLMAMIEWVKEEQQQNTVEGLLKRAMNMMQQEQQNGKSATEAGPSA
jgi:hypothetical protein